MVAFAIFVKEVLNVNYFFLSTTIIFPGCCFRNDVTKGALRATGVTSFVAVFLPPFL